MTTGVSEPKMITSNIKFSISGIDTNYVNQLCVLNIDRDSIFDVYVDKINYSDKGATPAKPMVLSYLQDGRLVDNTSKIFGNNIPEVYFGRAVASIDLNEDGLSDIYVGDHGQDSGTFPGAQNFVLLSSSVYTLAKTLYGIPYFPTGLNHGFGYGIIDETGHISIINNSTRPDKTIPALELLVNTGNSLQNRPEKLPSYLAKTDFFGPSWAWANLVDINADGRSDLVLGRWDLSKSNSVFLINDGKGNFSESRSIDLPIPESRIKIPNAVQLAGIDIFNRGINDLVLSITEGGNLSNGGGYSVKYLQFLKNDGSGGFIDITNSAFPQDVIHGAVDWYSFVKPVDLNCDGYEDLLVQTSTSNSFVLLNDRMGHFLKGPSFDASIALDVCFPNSDGVPYIISTNNSNSDWGIPPRNAPTANGVTIYANNLPLGNTRYFYGSLKSPDVNGTGFNDVFFPGFGRATFNGGGGIDRISLEGAASDYAIDGVGNKLRIQHKFNSKISLEAFGTERVEFGDSAIAFDLNDNAGKAAKILGAVFGKNSLTNKEFVRVGLDLLDGGMSYETLAALAVSATKKSQSGEICSLLWANVFNKPPALSDIAPFKEMLDSGKLSVGALTALAADSSYNAANIDLVGLGLTGIEYI